MAATRCPLCGAAGSACGPHRPVNPVDSPALRVKEPGMAGLSNYDVVINGMATTLRLSEQDAKKRGLTKKPPAKAAAKPTEKPAEKPNK